jgi:phenylacetate-coenzyme A ligase PaaK-like adenylate-forming protein
MEISKLKVPDIKKLSHVQELCDQSDPYADFSKSDDLFLKAMKEISIWHIEKSVFYNDLAKSQNFKADDLKTVEDCLKIPHLWAHFFKGNEILSIPPAEVFLHLTSSGTTGQKSQIFFDEWTIKSAQAMVDAIFEKYGWITPNQKCNYILFSYQTEESSKLGTSYTDNFLCKYAPINEVFTALKFTGSGGHEFDVFGTIEAFKRCIRKDEEIRTTSFEISPRLNGFFGWRLERTRR